MAPFFQGRPMLYATAYKWTKTSRAIVRQLKMAGAATPIAWLEVPAHLRTDALLSLERQMLIHFVRDGVVALTARGQLAVKDPRAKT
jgi:hypothetical protein